MHLQYIEGVSLTYHCPHNEADTRQQPHPFLQVDMAKVPILQGLLSLWIVVEGTITMAQFSFCQAPVHVIQILMRRHTVSWWNWKKLKMDVTISIT